MSKKMDPGDEVETWQNGKMLRVGIVQHVYADGRAWISPALASDYRCPHVKRHVVTLADDA